MAVACGSCLGCRLDHSRMWATRIIHEAQCWPVNSFITLTYDPEHLPSDGSLNKSHFQKFMKRLRERFRDRPIRYYHCGEYGDELQRPHYHACLFNLTFPDQKLLHQKQGNALFTSELLQEVWGKGFCTVGELTFQSAAYVSRYCLKKVNGSRAHDHYLRCDENGVAYWLQPEYVTMSRRPGIGKAWFDQFKGDLKNDTVPVPGRGVLNKMPRYYDQLLEEVDPKLFARIKRQRQKQKEENPEEYTAFRLEQKFKVKKAQADQLKRTI